MNTGIHTGIGTIAAQATARGAAGVGVLRVSGPAVPDMAAQILGHKPRARHAHLCTVRDGDDKPLDRVLLLYFPAPHSYTGEHVLELHGHGSPVLLDLLLKRLLQLGARMARPGEFTERAFLNGKLDLAQAEAVADLIAGTSEASVRAALRSLEGAFSQRVHALVQACIGLRIWIEAAIDFPEEEIDFLAAPELTQKMSALKLQLIALLHSSRRGVRLGRGLHAVIVGRPNVGKSSLLNALAGSARAIVTEVPGTTRDLISEQIDIDGVGLTLVDTAGLHEASDAIEREGMRRAREEMRRADLGLLVTDDAHADVDLALLDHLPASAARLVVHNKIDLADGSPRSEHHGDIEHLWLSALDGRGLALLHASLKRLSGTESSGEDAVSARSRHVAALENAAVHLAVAESALLDDQAGELAAEELRDMQQALSEITGQFTSDDLLGRIFADFCIGK